MKSLYKPAMLTALLALVCAAFTGCNTMRGLGQDAEEAGEAIQDSAR